MCVCLLCARAHRVDCGGWGSRAARGVSPPGPSLSRAQWPWHPGPSLEVAAMALPTAAHRVTCVSVHTCVTGGRGTSVLTHVFSAQALVGGLCTRALGRRLAAVLATMGPAGRVPGTGPCAATFLSLLSHAADSFQGSALNIPLFLKIVSSAWGPGDSREAGAALLRFGAGAGVILLRIQSPDSFWSLPEYCPQTLRAAVQIMPGVRDMPMSQPSGWAAQGSRVSGGTLPKSLAHSTPRHTQGRDPPPCLRPPAPGSWPLPCRAEGG